MVPGNARKGGSARSIFVPTTDAMDRVVAAFGAIGGAVPMPATVRWSHHLPKGAVARLRRRSPEATDLPLGPRTCIMEEGEA